MHQYSTATAATRARGTGGGSVIAAMLAPLEQAVAIQQQAITAAIEGLELQQRWLRAAAQAAERAVRTYLQVVERTVRAMGNAGTATRAVGPVGSGRAGPVQGAQPPLRTGAPGGVTGASLRSSQITPQAAQAQLFVGGHSNAAAVPADQESGRPHREGREGARRSSGDAERETGGQ